MAYVQCPWLHLPIAPTVLLQDKKNSVSLIEKEWKEMHFQLIQKGQLHTLMPPSY